MAPISSVILQIVILLFVNTDTHISRTLLPIPAGAVAIISVGSCAQMDTKLTISTCGTIVCKKKIKKKNKLGLSCAKLS